ncbi:hypothetical protein Syun_005686 [Stephania yunnanensis]|uniref:Uncharacterized protein n=1 Tax=Stephania yunnanensis TaxID=152371 RepID=A0AAP0Q3P3_9MAGN
MRFLDLFVTASIPVLEVLLVTALGSFLAIDTVNILGEEARTHLNKVVFYVFNPPLVASKLAKTITVESVIRMWFMPVNILLTFIIGSLFGWMLILITKAPSHLRGLVLGCCAAGNLGNLLLVIIPAVCKEKSSPFGDPNVCQEYGMAYASLSLAVGAVYLWSYVYNIVRVFSIPKNKGVEVFAESSEVTASSYKEALLPSKDFSTANDYEDKFTLPYNISEETLQVSVFSKIGCQLKLLAKKINLKRLLAPSTVGAFFGFFIGLVPFVRRLIIGNDAPFRVIQDSASLLGDGAIPAVTLILGGNLVKGLKGSGIRKSLIIGIVAVRYILLPLSGIGIVKLASHFGLIHSDPLYQFVLMLQFSLPPAMNIGTMTQLFGAGESECSVIMLWTYSVASVFLTLWSTLFLWLVS